MKTSTIHGTEYKSDSMDVFATTSNCKSTSTNKSYTSFSDFYDITFNGRVGDLQLSDFTTTTENFGMGEQLSFSDWYVGGQLKLIITLAYKSNYDIQDTLLISEKINLNVFFTDEPTPTPVISLP